MLEHHCGANHLPEAGRMAKHKHTFSTSPTQENHQTIRAAVYARVSTRAQDADMQMRELREYAQRRGWQIAHEYLDRGVLWGKGTASRPGQTVG